MVHELQKVANVCHIYDEVIICFYDIFKNLFKKVKLYNLQYTFRSKMNKMSKIIVAKLYIMLIYIITSEIRISIGFEIT